MALGSKAHTIKTRRCWVPWLVGIGSLFPSANWVSLVTSANFVARHVTCTVPCSIAMYHNIYFIYFECQLVAGSRGLVSSLGISLLSAMSQTLCDLTS
ncbi:hypothetical protein B0T25DRAFT_332499 [Lasiosphaeria hispida]|uniref:Uncharacterized protein n=1 Tax=Lasiosphaeria hispida TaxID=260671 RepID=A0AAJ0H5R5_9PEZI|nr:hypothetical protein B0T25DRAFT_332499 [Lasiosphaeria hispida]